MKLKLQLFAILILWATAACAGPGASVRDSDGLTPLHQAAGQGDVARVTQLLREGADPLALDSVMGVSVLHKAVSSGNAKVVELLLKAGAILNLQSPSNGDTPLHDAIFFQSGNDLSIIRLLLDHGPNLSIRNRSGVTPLDAAKLLKEETVVALFETYLAAHYTAKGKALMQAVKSGDALRVRVMLASDRPNIEEPDEDGLTPLLWAAREGFVNIVQVLLDNGADPNHCDEWMKTTAGHKAAFWGRDEVLRLLISHHLNLDAQGGYNGYTALHAAVARKHIAVVKILLDAGARVDIRGHDGKLPIDLARTAGYSDISQLLIAAEKKKR